jgi:hypothetical protein
MVKLVIAVVLLAHGIGHSLGLLQVFKVATVNPAWDGGSWLLDGFVGATASQIVGSALWIVALVGFSVVAASVLGWLPGAWFGPVAIVSTVASLAGLALFPSAFPVTSTVGALAIDVIVLAATLFYRWQPSNLGA